VKCLNFKNKNCTNIAVLKIAEVDKWDKALNYVLNPKIIKDLHH